MSMDLFIGCGFFVLKAGAAIKSNRLNRILTSPIVFARYFKRFYNSKILPLKFYYSIMKPVNSITKEKNAEIKTFLNIMQSQINCMSMQIDTIMENNLQIIEMLSTITKRITICNKNTSYPYTVGEVARMVHRSKFIVCKWCREKKIPAVKIGREWAISIDFEKELYNSR